MSWGRPEFLKLLWLLPVFIFLLIAVERRWWTRIRMLPYMRNRSLLPGTPTRWLSGLRILMGSLATSLLLLAIAQPRWGFEWSEVKYSGIDIVVAIDVSKSMDAADAAPSRLEIAKRKLSDLMQLLRGDRLGIVAFAGAAFVQCPLTVDYQAVRIFVDLLDSDLIPVGGSSLAEAVQLSVRSLSDGGTDSSKSKAIILMSDGEDFGAELAEAIELAKSNRIAVYTLGIGTEAGAPIPVAGGGFKKDAAGNVVLTRLQSESLRVLAEQTGGVYASASLGDDDLQKIYIEPLRGKGQQSSTTEREKIFHERFQWFLLGALVLILLEWLVPPLIRSTASRAAGKRARVIGMLLFFSGFSFLIGAGLDLRAEAQLTTPAAEIPNPQSSIPDSEIAAFNQGVSAYRSGDYKSAEELFKAAAKSPDTGLRAKALYNLGSARAQQRRFKDAGAALEEAAKLDPDNQRIRDNLDFVRQQKDEEPPEQQKQDSDQSQEQNQNQEQKSDQSSEQKDPSASQSPATQPSPDDSGSPDSKDREDQKNQPQNANGQPSPEPSTQVGAEQNPSPGEASHQPQALQDGSSPEPQSSEIPTLATSPRPAAEGATENAVELQPGQISPQQAEQLLRSVDDKISKYLYRPEGSPKNPPKAGNKDW